MKAGVIVGIVGLALGAASDSSAQAVAPTSSQQAEQVQARFQIAAMEGVLERAVALGAQSMRVKVQQVAPELLFINGTPRARGFWLQGYGVFFDVDVPAIRRSVMWSVRVLDQNDHSTLVALRDLKSQVANVNDPDERRQLQAIIQRLERQIGPTGNPDGPDQPGAQPASARLPGAAPAHSPEDDAILQDPGLAYTNEVRNALVDAMIDYSAPISLAPTDYLTIAARDQEGTRLQPGDPYDVTTVLLRVRGADLIAYRGGQIDKAEVKRRVEVKEY